jgi:superoxide reductase
MRLLEEKTEDEGHEKHKPVIEKTDDGIKVLVGSVPHPMDKDHYIEWIEVLSGDNTCKKFLKPGQPPEAELKILDNNVRVREYCTVHGLWSA